MYLLLREIFMDRQCTQQRLKRSSSYIKIVRSITLQQTLLGNMINVDIAEKF